MTLSKRATILLVSAILALAIALILIFYPPVRETVMTPIVNAWIATRYALALLSERVQWTAALGILVVLLVLAILKRAPRDRGSKRGRPSAKIPTQGPMMRIEHILDRARRNRFAREQAMLELRDLAARVLAFRHSISIPEAKELIDKGTWTDDPAVRALFVRAQDKKRLRSGQDFHNDTAELMSTIEKLYQEV